MLDSHCTNDDGLVVERRFRHRNSPRWSSDGTGGDRRFAQAQKRWLAGGVIPFKRRYTTIWP